MNRSIVWLPENAPVCPMIESRDKKLYSDFRRETSMLRITR
jgi:hypothetical protein